MCGAELEEDHSSDSTQPVIPEAVTPFVHMPEAPVPIEETSSPQTVQPQARQSVSPPIIQTSTNHMETQKEFIIPPVDAVFDEANLEKDEKELLAKHYQQIGAYFHSDETLLTSIPVISC